MERISRVRRVCIVLLAMVVCVLGALEYDTRVRETHLVVSFLDVGQGDATFIETPTGTQILIDGGFDQSVLRELSTQLGFWDRSIDVVVATHFDADHIGGLVDVLARYQVGTVLMNDELADSSEAKAFVKAVAAEEAEVLFVTRGQELRSGDVRLSVLFPDRELSGMERNTGSIVMQLHHGDNSFLLMADAPQSIERYLVESYGEMLSSQVLKVGHHGSKTSTASAFEGMVNPDYAVISAGCDNRYGHPHQVVLETLADSQVLGTCQEGTITFLSNGSSLWRK